MFRRLASLSGLALIATTLVAPSVAAKAPVKPELRGASPCASVDLPAAKTKGCPKSRPCRLPLY